MGNNHKFYTVQQLSEMLGLHLQTIRGYIKKGQLRAFSVGRRYRVSEKDLKAFLEKRKVTYKL